MSLAREKVLSAVLDDMLVIQRDLGCIWTLGSVTLGHTFAKVGCQAIYHVERSVHLRCQEICSYSPHKLGAISNVSKTQPAAVKILAIDTVDSRILCEGSRACPKRLMKCLGSPHIREAVFQ